MREGFPAGKEKRPWSPCPNCGVDLKARGTQSKPQYLEACPFCGAPIVPVWWWSTLRSVAALVLALAIPAYLGVGKGVTMVFLAVLLCFPALVLAQTLLIAIIPPKYALKEHTVTTLFHR